MSGIIDLTSDDDPVTSPTPPHAHDTTASDQEDEDLKLAIALSLQDQDTQDPVDSEGSSHDEPTAIAEPTESPAIQGSLLGLDRKAMEAERLARLKRKREPDSDVDTNTKRPAQLLPQRYKSTAATATITTASEISPPPTRRPKPTTSTQPTPQPSNPHPTFPTPQILLTSHPSRLSLTTTTTTKKYASISLPTLLTPPSPTHTLTSAILSSYTADLDWLLPRFSTRTTNFVFILHAASPQHRALLTADFAGLPNVGLVLPEVIGAGSMHSKLMVLFYREGETQGRGRSSGKGEGDMKGEEKGRGKGSEICRLVIPSANLTGADWGVGGVMENILFVVDLPLRFDLGGENQQQAQKQKQKQEQKQNVVGRFERGLRAQLSGMSVSEDVIRKLDRFDFEPTRGVQFVWSRSGSLPVRTGSITTTTARDGGTDFFDKKKKTRITKGGDAGNQTHVTDSVVDDPARTGLLSLQDAVVSSGLEMQMTDLDDLPLVDFVTSSLGNLTSQFVRQLYQAICGQLDPVQATSGPRRSDTKAALADTALDQTILENLKIYFPATGTVQRSKGGPGAGGTICFQRKWWETNNLVRRCLHDCVGVRGDGILMHSKVLYVRFKTPKIICDDGGHDNSYAGWAYVGSANLSESAWGRVVSNAKSRQPKLTCRNWESGVLIPVEAESAGQSGRLDGKVAEMIKHQRSEEAGNIEKGVGTGVAWKQALQFKACTAPTSSEEGARQTKAGKGDEASLLHPDCEPTGGGRSDGKSITTSTARARKRATETNRTREVPSLAEVFAEVVTVPFEEAAGSQLARQQTPWFFTE